MLTPPDDWIVPDWPAPAHVRALITTRHGGNSVGPYTSLNMSPLVGDDPSSVEANRRFLRQFLPDEPKWLNQVHGTRVVNAETVARPLAADASIARNPGCVSVVLVADCLPILISDRAGNRVAAVHAGWRGLVAGVIENTVRALDVSPHHLLAYLGPAIGPLAFEVGNEVRDAFLAIDEAAQHGFKSQARGKWLADLSLLAHQRLAGLGITSVYGEGQCTYTERERFFSHRRDKVSGRMAALVWIED